MGVCLRWGIATGCLKITKDGSWAAGRLGMEKQRWVARGGWTELLVEDNAEKRAIHLQPAVVVDEAKLSEFVHEEIHS